MKKLYKYLKNIKVLIIISSLLLPPLLLIHSHGSLFYFAIFIFAFSLFITGILSTNLFLNCLDKEGAFFTKINLDVDLSYSTRITLAVLGSLFLLLFVIDISFSIIICNKLYNALVITFFFYGFGIMSWILALCNNSFTEIDFNMIRKQKPVPAAEKRALEEVIQSPEDKEKIIKKRKVVSYLIPILISASTIIAGLKKFFSTNLKTEGVIEIVIGITVAALAFFTFRKIFNKSDNDVY